MSRLVAKDAPDAKARRRIDALLEEAVWTLQFRGEMNLLAADAVL